MTIAFSSSSYIFFNGKHVPLQGLEIALVQNGTKRPPHVCLFLVRPDEAV